MKQKNILFTDMDGTILFSDNGKTYFKESDLDAMVVPAPPNAPHTS